VEALTSNEAMRLAQPHAGANGFYPGRTGVGAFAFLFSASGVKGTYGTGGCAQ